MHDYGLDVLNFGPCLSLTVLSAPLHLERTTTGCLSLLFLVLWASSSKYFLGSAEAVYLVLMGELALQEIGCASTHS